MTKEIRILDKGFVRLEIHAGGDESVLRSARVSYGKNPEPNEDRDRKLISYLLAHDHGTPFEHNLFTFHIKAPILVFRQWHRSRIGVSYNELSARYTEMKDEFYIPNKWRSQEVGHKANKQGSVAANVNHDALSAVLINSCEASMSDYRRLLEMGAAKEMARTVLPVSLYSEMYFSCNARSLMAFIRLRSDTHAQWEMRQYSHALALFFRDSMPLTFEALYAELQKDEKAGKRDYSELKDVLMGGVL